MAITDTDERCAEQPDFNASTTSNPNIELNLGIDFGTSFTKVCFRNAGTEESEILNFSGGEQVDGALLPSSVKIGPEGSLQLDLKGDGGEGWYVFRHLKMKLAQMESLKRDDDYLGVNFNEKSVREALSSWFLATIVQKSQNWIKVNRGDLIRGRSIDWSANVGVPVEHYDSPKIKNFEKVFSVGWKWVQKDEIPGDLLSVLRHYKLDTETIHVEKSNCRPMPEVAAAVQSFVTSREASEGIYLYFDIGGGTLDGVSFNYFNPDGEKSINFYAGKVDSLGVSSVAEIFGNCADQVESILMNESIEHIEQCLKSFQLQPNLLIGKRKKVQEVVGFVVATAKEKNPQNNWEKAERYDVFGARKALVVDPETMVRLPVFVGGGGAKSKWFQDAILCTHKDFGHFNIKVPPYHLVEVPVPKDLALNGLAADSFYRFAVAYGLSVPFGEGPEIRLPCDIRQIDPAEAKKVSVPNYLDHKEKYD